jgi:hypothetical protein
VFPIHFPPPRPAYVRPIAYPQRVRVVVTQPPVTYNRYDGMACRGHAVYRMAMPAYSRPANCGT